MEARVRQDRRSSLLRRLLAEHHVYVRSGGTSRYVALRWPWQVGVIVAMIGLAAWLGMASVGWRAAHLETLDQRRALAELVQANRQLAALLAARDEERERTAPARLMTLVAQLEGLKSGGRFELPDAVAAEEGSPAAGRLAERLLPAAMPADGSNSAREWLYDRIARQGANHSGAAEAIRLRAELRAARAEIARLEDALAAALRDVIDP
jgi:hypothetical protein